jgi:hypothetical protein
VAPAPVPTKLPVDVIPNQIEAFPGGTWLDQLHRKEIVKIC